MTAVDGVYWALALAIVIIAAALTFLIVRLAGTVGRANRILGDMGAEVPASAASVRKVLGNVERLTADAAETAAVVKDAASLARVLVDRGRAAVKFLDETVFSKLAALAPLFALVGSFLGRVVVAKPAPGGEGPRASEEE